MSEEQCEAFGRDVYFILVQIVFDNGFSLPARLSFPKLNHDFTLLSLQAWIDRMHVWFADLSKGEQEMFRQMEFLWP